MTRKKRHGHMLWVGILGILAGAGFLFYAPTLKAVSRTLFLFAGFHIAGFAVISASAYVIGADKLVAHFAPHRRKEDFNFGWEPGWTLGPFIAAAVLIASAVLVEVAAPRAWPAAMVCTLLAASFFAGGLFARTVMSVENAVLPMVNFMPAGVADPVVLDSGCGSGRTIVALARAVKQGSIVALDRFDAGYIEGGGKTLLEQNLRLAGLQDRVRITPGDITQLAFPDATFDLAISAHAMDHLGRGTDQGLREIHRVLKPGGRFLLIVWIPGWTMFTIANVLCLFLASPRVWRRRIVSAGFRLADEGRFNGYWFAVLERPGLTPAPPPSA